MADPAFGADAEGLARAVGLLVERVAGLPVGGGAGPAAALPERLPEAGIGAAAALEALAALVIGGARRLGAPTAFAHMDPPTPWVA